MCGFVVLVLSNTAGAAAVLPQNADAVHVGVKTCANSDCHAAPKPWPNSLVLQNEHRTWKNKDPHSGSYHALSGAEGKRIASHLGVTDPQTSKRCLSCHADFVPPALQGEDYALADGVGCEGCHGGARGWIGSHSTGWSTRPESVAAGMYPTHEPEPRAILCLSCHQNNAERTVDHEMYAAGHPRLVFELDTYTLSQPAHFRLDDDYRARKPDGVGNFAMWRAGQLQAARIQLSNIERYLADAQSAAPEFSLFECFVCHQPMDGEYTGSGPLPAGVPRLRTSALLMVQALADAFAPTEAEQLSEARQRLSRATAISRADVASAASGVLGVVDAIDQATQSAKAGEATLQALLRSVVGMGAAGYFVDYTAAEQAVTATAMVIALTKDERSGAWSTELDRLYVYIEREADFAHSGLRRSFAQLKTMVGEG